MKIQVTNFVNGEIYEMTPEPGQAREAFSRLWHHAREVDAYDRVDCRSIRDIMGDSFDGQYLPVRNIVVEVR